MKIILKTSLIALSVFLIGCNDEKATQNAAAMPSLVDVRKVVVEDAKVYYKYSATLQADNYVSIMPKISGEIKKIYFKDGDFVKAGTVLYKIDDEQIKANYDVSLADVEVANANYENAKTDYERSAGLYEKKAISQKEYESKLANYKSAKANLTKANSALKLAKLNLDYTEVKAPFSGLVQDSLVDVGSYAVANNTKLVNIINQDNLKAVFYIPDSSSLNFSFNGKDWDFANAKAHFSLNNKEYNGSLEYLSNDIELASSKAYALFKNTDYSLKNGTYVNLVIDNISKDNSFVIKKENLLQDINGYYVYVKKNNKAEQVYVNPIFDDENIAVVSAENSKLKAGDELILNNYKKIYPGASVATDAEFKAMMSKQASAKEVKE